jgi:competence ComEA-like helix-hairpin-helix protein
MISRSIGLSAALFVASIAIAAATQDPQPPQTATPAPASTEALDVVEEAATPVFNKMCTKCHTPDRVLSQRRTRTQWEEVLDKMTKLGASGTDEEWETVQTYLLKHYGRLNINRAPADDIVLVLNLSPEEAAAIVGYRKDKGEFADFDALTKVPGVKVEKLQQSRTAITF